jgi:medium-chain acyl-[acyl-carrier-protein] hydrolase
LDIDITAFEGKNDQKAQGDNILAWQDLTRGQFNHHQIEGDHFFIHSAQQQVLQLLKQQLQLLN